MISILITHYNRLEALEECLLAFKELQFEKNEVEIVVSDDGSSKEVQKRLEKLPIDHLLLSKQNTGLTSNLNRGIRSCKRDYILYCQEDFLPKTALKEYIPEILNLLDLGKVDMVRLQANYKFPKLLKLTNKIKLIPKFSWQNYYYNTFQYSDNPFITSKSFFETYGYFLEKTSGSYGENEYAIRIMKSKAKIAIVDKYPFKGNAESVSVMDNPSTKKKRRLLKKMGIHKFIRATRLHLEYIFYNPKKRGLLTMKNKRKD